MGKLRWRNRLKCDGEIGCFYSSANNILKAVRAVGYLEDMSATLWRLAGPEIADEAIVDYDRSVADVAALLGLEARDYD